MALYNVFFSLFRNLIAYQILFKRSNSNDYVFEFKLRR